MGSAAPLPASCLHAPCDPGVLPFETSADLEALDAWIGQGRAIEAVRLGTEMRLEGYNLFVLGPPGTGRHGFVRQLLHRQAERRPAPSDWCYVNNFADPRRPRALELPAGAGRHFRDRMKQLVDEACAAIPAAFESDEYASRRRAIEKEAEEEQEEAFEELRRKALELGLGIVGTDKGFSFLALRDGKPITSEEFEALPEEERRRIEEHTETMTRELGKTLRTMPPRVRRVRLKLQELDRDVAFLAVGGLLDELLEEYRGHAGIRDHPGAMKHDIADNVELFSRREDGRSLLLQDLLVEGDVGEGRKKSPVERRYDVNLLVSREEAQGAPIVFEDHPAHAYLVGQIEHVSRLGVLSTDFHHIRPGSLHRANGGYLVLDAEKVLMEPFAWSGLKRVLKAGKIEIRSLAQAYGIVGTATLEPEAIPLDVKVVLVGDRFLYHLLEIFDPEFLELFKVAADFEDRMDRTGESELELARLLGAIGRREDLLPFDRNAAARLIEESARHAGDAQMLSTRFGRAIDLMQEAHYWAMRDGREVIGREDVQHAIEGQHRRMARIQDERHRQILRGVIRIDTEGARVGQANGLSAVELAGQCYGQPTRITARISVGSGEVIDIEREVELGGPIHSKGVLILSGFLASRYAPDRPLSLSASVVFEQSYLPVEGDSASAAELCSLLSAVGEVPLRQSMAVTGSVDQHGDIQAVGAVNQKIEGFFDVCRARGLSGDQGVIIPATNVGHLMLRQDVIDAVEEGRFQVYPAATVDDCMEIFTGMEAGRWDPDGGFPTGTLNHRIRESLLELAEKRRAFGLEEPR